MHRLAVPRLLSGLLTAAMLGVVACAPAAQPSPTAAPAKPPTAPAASPAASPAAKPAASPSPSPAAAAPAGAQAAAKPASGPPTKLGLLTPLSPPGDAAAGQLIQRGAELAVPFINQRLGGNIWNASCNLPGPIELVVQDDSGTPEKAVAGFRKMAQEDKVAAVGGQFHSSNMLAVSPVADQLKVPIMSAQASNSKISENHLEYTFQAHVVDRDRVQLVAEFIAANKSLFKKVAVVAENTDYGTGSVDEFKKAMASQSDVEVRDWVFDRTSADLSPLLLQVKQFDPSLVFNIAVGAPTYLMIKQSYDTGLLPNALQLVSYDLPIRPEYWQNLGPQGNNILFVAYYSPQMALSEAGKWMQQEYQKKYNEPALYSSFQGFGNMLLYAQAINQACSTDGDAIVKALESGKLMNWNATGVSMPKADGIDWHRIKMPILILQYTEPNQTFDKAPILFPQNMKSGEIKRPS